RGLSQPQVGALRQAVGQLRLESAWVSVLQQMQERPGPSLADPGPDPRQTRLLEWLAKDSSYVVARAATGPSTTYHDAAARHGGPVSLRTLLQVAETIARTEPALPRSGGPTDDMPEAAALQRRLEELDAEPAQRHAEPEWQAAVAKASLDLGRRHLEGNARDSQLLLEDAAQY